MSTIYSLRQIDYYVPQSNMKKVIPGFKFILGHLQTIERVKLYIDWFLSQSRFQNSGYNLNMLFSGAVLNQFMTAKPSETKEGMAFKIIEEDEREEYGLTHGIVV